MKPRLRTRTTTGSILRPGLSSVYNFNIVLLLPPAPAALVLAGLVLATCAALSAAFRLRMAVFGPPGGVGENGRAPDAADGVPGPLLGGFGDAARGEEDMVKKNIDV